MTWNRRALLKMIGAAPVAAKAAADGAMAGLVTGHVSPGLFGGLHDQSSLDVAEGPQPHKQQPRPEFKDFVTWWREGGAALAREQAKRIEGFDPDILAFRLPWATKIRMQQDRNFERMKAERQDWFARTLRKQGFVRWYEW